MILTFDTEPEDFPLQERIILRDGVAFFESQPGSVDITEDADYLKLLPRIRCWYGACNCWVYPFICIPKEPLTSIPVAKTVLEELRPLNFRSAHIESLDTCSIPSPGYHPGTENDEIHSESETQNIFSCPEKPEKVASIEDAWSASLLYHQGLKDYVLSGHLYYVLLHSKPFRRREVGRWVILFAVGVSPGTGNLVGCITHKMCHNLCD